MMRGTCRRLKPVHDISTTSSYEYCCYELQAIITQITFNKKFCRFNLVVIYLRHVAARM